MPFNEQGYCEVDTVKDMVTNCKGTMGYANYVGAGLFTLLAVICVAALLFVIIYCLLYYMASVIGHAFLTRNDRHKYDFAASWPIDYKSLAAGHLILLIIVTGIVSFITVLFWLGHLVI